MKRLLAILSLLALLAAAFVAAGAGEPGSYKVRAIFDNAAFVVKGEDVKVAGVRVGKISDLGVTEDNKAAITLNIEDPAFQDFRADATCKVRPQSLIGEEYVDCVPTKPRQAGEPLPPALKEVEEGVRLLPVTNTSASVDLDLIGEALRRPYRERLSIIIAELGAGVAGRGKDLNEVIRRANPALKETDAVLRILARQNDTLEQLAVDSDEIMVPLARERRTVTGFIEDAGDVAQATAERREALQANFRKLPNFLRELRPTMARLGSLADEMTPVVSDLGDTAPRLNTLLRNLGPFSRAGTPALQRLGDVAEPGIPALNASRPIIADLRALNRELAPVADTLRDVLVSFQKNEGVERLLDYIFFQATAVNGFDSAGHFLRAALIVNVCSQYATAPVGGCSANFRQDAPPPTAAAARSFASTSGGDISRLTDAVLRGQLVPGEAERKAAAEEKKAAREAARERRAAAAAPSTPQAEPAPTAAAPEPSAQPAVPTQELLDYLLGSDE
jgi:ABC-type transporter Mla subunit MlaD